MAIGGKLYSGMDSIRDNLGEAYLTAGEDIFVYQYVDGPAADTDEKLFQRYTVNEEDSTLVYFYRVTCDECGITKPVIDALPETIELDGKKSAVKIVPMNTRSGKGASRIRAFFDAYDVPEEDQMVPIVFLRDRYLAGYEAISRNLEKELAQGAGLGFQFPG